MTLTIVTCICFLVAFFVTLEAAKTFEDFEDFEDKVYAVVTLILLSLLILGGFLASQGAHADEAKGPPLKQRFALIYHLSAHSESESTGVVIFDSWDLCRSAWQRLVVEWDVDLSFKGKCLPIEEAHK